MPIDPAYQALYVEHLNVIEAYRGNLHINPSHRDDFCACCRSAIACELISEDLRDHFRFALARMLKPVISFPGSTSCPLL
jgi:hypothetical protein